MQTYNYNLTHNRLDDIIEIKDYNFMITFSSIFIQVFSGKKYEQTQNILYKLKQKFPHAKIITTSTDGEIQQDTVTSKSIVISISLFNSTKLKTFYTNTKECFNNGVSLAKNLVTPQTKLLILFIDGINTNGEEFLKGIHSIAPDVIVSGGLSGDNGEFKKCFIGIDDTLYNHGAVGVALDSKNLKVQNLYSLGWDKIGLEHTITKARSNRIYEIDNIKALDFYEKYLGKEAAKRLPALGMEFPLIFEKDGISIARAMVQKNEDGSINFAGNIPTGTQVHIGLGNIDKILTNHISTPILNTHETFFIYSCMARRRFIPNDIFKEITQFSNIATTTGFFTYGEFYTADCFELLNQTLTAVALCEPSLKKPTNNLTIKKRRDLNHNDITIKVLTNILTQTYSDLEQQHKYLKKRNLELETSKQTFTHIQEIAKLGNWQLNLKTKKITWTEVSYKLFNRNPNTQPPSFEEFLEMVFEEDRKKLLSEIEKLIDGNVHSVVIRVKRNDGKVLHLLESARYIFENGTPTKIIGTTLNITEYREQEQHLIQQAHLAQMGEMINMVAHQWRQPLNAINAAAVKLELKNNMQILNNDELAQTITFIQDTTQRMSNTINDFMELTNPNKTIETISIKSIFTNIDAIIENQLKSKNINLFYKYDKKAKVKIHKNEIIHVIINLILNARDQFDGQEGEEKQLIVSWEKIDKQNIIKIQDNAGGIKQNIINRIFEPYFTTKTKGIGTGLGLYMSKKILNEVLNGDLSVSNTKKGAEFIITLNI